jgi:hypothetical protein
MEKLDEEAGALDGESTHPQPTLILGSANLVPCDQTLGPADALARIPEEGAAKGIQSLDDGGRELHGRHSLRMWAGALRLAQHWIILVAYTKFSEMERPAMNPD